MTPALLRTEELSVGRGDRILARGLNLSVQPGQLLHLRGRNGAGKTSLLEVLAGLRAPESGRVHRPVSGLHWLGHKNALNADLTGIGATRRSVGRSGEMQITEAAIAATCNDIALTNFSQVSNQRLIIFFKDLRADGHFHQDVSALGTGAVAPHAMPAGAGFEMLLIAVVDERVQPLDAFRPHITAASAIATIGAAELDKFFTPE